MATRKLTAKQVGRSKQLAKKLKGEPGVTNPFALAHALVQGKTKRQRRRRT